MASAEQLITENLAIWASAVQAKSAAGRGKSNKLDLYGIKKLRELILELAVRGLLVPQDPGDEPASELLKKIAVEKDKLVKEGQIKKQKSLPPIEDGEEPFELPSSWTWLCFVELANEISTGPFGSMVHKTDYVEGGVPLINPSHMIGGQIVEESSVTVSKKKAKELSSHRLREGDVVMARRGEMGRCALVTEREKDWLCGTGSFVLRFNEKLCREFILLAFSTRWAKTHLGGESVGATMTNLNHGILKKMPFCLPPVDEQHRIVTKVDELMALCDQLGQQQEATIGDHQILVQTLLGALTSASERYGFDEAWARIADHFDTLFTTEWSIDQLKQTLLQLAVMGKLVPQDSSDESASALLKKITIEKAKLLKDGKIKKQKSMPPIEEDEKPFELPKGWKWERLENCIDAQRPTSYGVLKPGVNDPNGPLLVKSQHIRDGFVDTDIDCRITPELDEQFARTRILGGEILMNLVGASIGRCAIAPKELAGANVSRAVAVICTNDLLDRSYCLLNLRAFMTKEKIIEQSSGSAQPVLNLGNIRLFVLPIPPIQEQRSIVAKVDELMVLCEMLKESLQGVQTTQLHLADVIGAGAFS